MSTQTIRPARTLQGSLTLPGDKSISHRYAMLAGLAEGTTRLSNFSTGADPRSSLACMEALGAKVVHNPDRTISITGTAGAFQQPAGPLDCGNSGSTMRMLSGLIAPHPHTFTLIGDHSLTLRPMERIRKPLSQMGVKMDLIEGHAPITIHGGPLSAIDFDTPIPSAQVKTAVLFAGLQAEGVTSLSESIRTRDHSEHALKAFGATLTRTGDRLSIPGNQRLKAIDATVPGDISSAAFFLCAALLFPDANLVLDSLGMHPTRAALLDLDAIHHQRSPHCPGHRRTPRPRRHCALHREWPHHPRRPGASRQGIRPHRPGRKEPRRHGRHLHRVPRRPRDPRQSATPRRQDRLRHPPPHRHGLLD